MHCTIWCRLCNLGGGGGDAGVPTRGVLLLVELQAKACNFAGGSTPP